MFSSVKDIREFCRRAFHANVKIKKQIEVAKEKKILVNGEQITDPSMIRFTESCMENLKSLRIENEGVMKVNGKLQNKIDKFDGVEIDLKDEISYLVETKAEDRQLIVDLNMELRKMSRYVDSIKRKK